MATFGDYARYYNVLYQDKDYAGEMAFILSTLQQHGCTPKTLLDLGCGTGRHALEVAQHGVAVQGVDLSETMLRMGAEAMQQLAPQQRPATLPILHQGDARTVRLNKKFDAVTSLFHVMSYQTTEADALAVLHTAKEHLAPGGYFLFDFWHGPGVQAEPPTYREKTMQDATTCVHRVATPVVHECAHVVDVHYTINLTGPAAPVVELKECHSMRYWWVEELETLAIQAGFSPVASGGWMQGQKATSADWCAWIVVRQ